MFSIAPSRAAQPAVLTSNRDELISIFRDLSQALSQPMRSSAPVEFARRVRPRVVERVGHGWRFLPTLPRSTRSTAGGRPAPAARAPGLGDPRRELAPHRREAAVRRAGHLVGHSHEVASQGGRAAVHQGRSPGALPTHGRRDVVGLPHDRPTVGVAHVARSPVMARCGAAPPPRALRRQAGVQFDRRSRQPPRPTQPVRSRRALRRTSATNSVGARAFTTP
jgi:hypothetical protein